MFDVDFAISTFFESWKGVPVTLLVTFGSALIACVVGLFFAILRIKKIKIVSQLIAVFTSYIRGTPMIIQIFLVYYGLPRLVTILSRKYGWGISMYDINALVYAFIVFGLNAIAKFTEVFRSALNGVSHEQMEAAYSVGLTEFQSYVRIVLPQAIVSAVPNIMSNIINLFKNCSLLFVMGIADITGIAKSLGGSGYRFLEAYVDIFLLYLILCLTMERVFNLIEKRVKRFKHA